MTEDRFRKRLFALIGDDALNILKEVKDMIDEARSEFPWDDFAIPYAKEKWGYEIGDLLSNPEHVIELLNEYIQRRDKWYRKWFGIG